MSRSPMDITESLNSLVTGESIDRKELIRQLFYFNLEQVQEIDPKLAEMMPACAIPRSFDATIIGVLRDKPNECEENERLLNGLLEFNFVISRKDKGFVYHDNTRDFLLEDWRLNPERREQFDLFNQKLVSFYQNQHEEAQKLEYELCLVAKIVQEANLQRYVQLASEIEIRIVSPLLDALYHETLRSVDDGFNFFKDQYHLYENRGQFTVCKSILNATRDYIKRLSLEEERESLFLWLRYYEARLENKLYKYQKSEDILKELLPQVEKEQQLKLWILGDLSISLESQLKLSEAREVCKQELALAEETNADPYNLAESYSRIASVYTSLGELKQAVEKYQDAIQTAQEKDNPKSKLFQQLALSSLLYTLGSWDAALITILEVLHETRTQFLRDTGLNQAVAQQFMQLVFRRSPAILDTIFTETRELFPAGSDLCRMLLLNSYYVGLLRDSGCLTQAESKLADLKSQASSYTDAILQTEILFQEQLLCDSQGNANTAIDLCTQIIQHYEAARGIAWNHAASLANRGIYQAELSNWEEAEKDLKLAITKWQEIGNTKLSAFVKVTYANMHRQQGDLVAAQTLLKEAGEIVLGDFSSYLADYYQIQGHIYRDQGNWQGAEASYQQALKINQSLDQHQQSARNLNYLAATAADQGHWQEAASYTNTANQLWCRLAEADHYRPTEVAIQADEDNAQGLKILSSSEQRKQKIEARDLFRSASERFPENFWYSLNLMYACAELEEWAEAIESVKTIIHQGPDWIRSPIFLYERLFEYSLKHGSYLLKAERYEEAAKTYADTYKQLASKTLSLVQLALDWQNLGDCLLRLGRFQDAQKEYEAALTCAVSSEDPTLQASFYARLGFLLVIQTKDHNSSGAYRRFVKALELYHVSDEVMPGILLGEACQPLIRGVSDYWRLDSIWQTLPDCTETNQKLRKDFSDARRSLARYLSDVYKLSSKSSEDSHNFLSVTPLVVEVGDAVVPLVDPKQDNGHFINELIPQMRDRIKTDFGINIPGIRLRANPALAPEAYLFVIDEVPIARGNVHVGMYFFEGAIDVLNEIGIADQTISDIHPLTHKTGYWVPNSAQTALQAAGHELIQSPNHLLDQFEALIRRNLVRFFGIQDAETLLQSWESSETGKSLVAGLHLTSRDRLRLIQVLRELIRDRVPLTQGETILKALQGANLASDDIHHLTRLVRLQIRQQLPGNNPGTIRVPILLAEEQKLFTITGDRAIFIASPQQKHEFLVWLRDQLQELQTEPFNTVLVTPNPEPRPLLRRLIEPESADLMVLSQEEVLEFAETLSSSSGDESSTTNLSESPSSTATPTPDDESEEEVTE